MILIKKPSELPRRFWQKVVKTKTCWIWIASKRKGYGRFWQDGAYTTAHVLAYEARYGAVPKGKELDHTCGNKACVRPSHLEPVSHAENIRRSFM